VPPELTALLEREAWGNPLARWGLALAVALLATLAALLARRVLERRLRASSERAQADGVLVDAVAAIRTSVVVLAGVVAAAHLLVLPDRVLATLRGALVLAGILQLGLLGNVAVRVGVARYLSGRGGEADDPARQTGEALIGLLGRTVVWSTVALLILANVGVDITALVAGLGVGGIAVALALQNVLSDLFASVSILLDKPFRRGDFIIVGDLLGSIEKIGLKTTRIRSLWGEQLILSNNDLLSSRIRNYKRMRERRIHFEVGVVYGTPGEKLEHVGRIIRESIEAQDQARFDRAHLKAFADFSLVYEAAYYVLSPDYTVYMDVNEAIHVAIFRRFEEEGIEFAFPTRTVYLQRETGAAPTAGEVGQPIQPLEGVDP
jgi:small-conductance mechanosensitive channel